MRQKFSHQPVVEETVKDIQWATRKHYLPKRTTASPQLEGADSAIGALPCFAKTVGNRIGCLLDPRLSSWCLYLSATILRSERSWCRPEVGRSLLG